MTLCTRLLAIALIAACVPAAADEPRLVTEAGIGISEYFRATHPGAFRGQLDMPLVLVAASPDRLISRTAGSVEHPLSGDQLAEQVRASLGEAGTDTVAVKTILSAVRQADGTSLDVDAIRFPAVIQIRLEANPRTPEGTALNATRDDMWEASLRRLHADGESGFSLIVISIAVVE